MLEACRRLSLRALRLPNPLGWQLRHTRIATGRVTLCVARLMSLRGPGHSRLPWTAFCDIRRC
eukprot:1864760-Alexandrium_andersonii.AAC.1